MFSVSCHKADAEIKISLDTHVHRNDHSLTLLILLDNFLLYLQYL